MSTARPLYDPDLRMFVEPERDPDPGYLYFMRWLVESGRLGPPVAGPPSGEFTAEFWVEVRLARDDIGI